MDTATARFKATTGEGLGCVGGVVQEPAIRVRSVPSAVRAPGVTCCSSSLRGVWPGGPSKPQRTRQRCEASMDEQPVPERRRFRTSSKMGCPDALRRSRIREGLKFR